MNNELTILGSRVSEKKNEIAKKVHEIRKSEATGEHLKLSSQLDEAEVIKIRSDFIELFSKALIKGLKKDEAYDAIEKWGKETGEYTHNLGIPLDEALKDTSYYRTFINSTIEETAVEESMSVRSVFQALSIIDPLMDHAVYCFSLTYVHFYKKSLEEAKNAFLELSVPVVPLAKGIAILPLIGNIDEERAHQLMEQTLSEANRLKLSSLILDLSGVAMVDTMVADQIFKVVSALKLLGVQTIVTGIRPEIAQTAVNLGLDFSTQATRANLQQALSDLQLIKIK